jgi:hypothetical protein
VARLECEALARAGHLSHADLQGFDALHRKRDEYLCLRYREERPDSL